MSARLNTRMDTTLGPITGRIAIPGHMTFSLSAVPLVRPCHDGMTFIDVQRKCPAKGSAKMSADIVVQSIG